MRLASALTGAGFSMKAALAAIRTEQEVACDPPLAAEEVELVVRRAFEREAEESGVRLQALTAFRAGSGLRQRFRLHDDEEIQRLPPPTWLIEDVLPARGFGVMWGPPGSKKTFTAIDQSFCVATGTPWLGRAVRQGPVVYIAAEGATGIGVRVEAWKRAQKFSGLAGVHFVTCPVALLESAEVSAFLEVIVPVAPVLVVIDTLARCMLGGDEDSAKDMGRAVAAVDEVRRTCDCFVQLVHHPTKRGDHERGSGALRGAADTVISVSSTINRLKLKCEKQKDAKEFAPIELELVPLNLRNGVQSGVIAGLSSSSDDTDAAPRENELRALKALATMSGPQTLNAWRAATGNSDVHGEIPNRTFQRIATTLLDAGYVRQLNKRGRYEIRAAGTATANGQPINSQGS